MMEGEYYHEYDMALSYLPLPVPAPFRPLTPAVGAGFRFKCSSNEGALLVLPDGASRKNLIPLNAFREYAIVQTPAWYNFVTHQLNRIISNGSLYLVTGVDKARSWGVASYSNIPGERHILLRPSDANDISAPATRHYAWERSGQVAARAGPRRPVRHENQCVFVRGYKLALRTNRIASALKGQVKLSHTEDSDPKDIIDRGQGILGTFKSPSFGSSTRHHEPSTSGASQLSDGCEPRNTPEVLVQLFPDIPEVMAAILLSLWFLRADAIVAGSRTTHPRSSMSISSA